MRVAVKQHLAACKGVGLRRGVGAIVVNHVAGKDAAAAQGGRKRV